MTQLRNLAATFAVRWAGYALDIAGAPGALADTGLVKPGTWVDWITMPAPLAYLLIGSGTTLIVLHFWAVHEQRLRQMLKGVVSFMTSIPQQRAFSKAPRSGQLAATLLAKQRTAEGAKRVYEIWKAQKDGTDAESARGAYSDALYRLGETDESVKIAMEDGWARAHTGEDFLAPNPEEPE